MDKNIKKHESSKNVPIQNKDFRKRQFSSKRNNTIKLIDNVNYLNYQKLKGEKKNPLIPRRFYR